MTDEQLLAWAKQAGITAWLDETRPDLHLTQLRTFWLDAVRPDLYLKRLRQFADLVAGAQVAAAIAAERERICLALPGGDSVDPQWVADMVRNGALGKTRKGVW